MNFGFTLASLIILVIYVLYSGKFTIGVAGLYTIWNAIFLDMKEDRKTKVLKNIKWTIYLPSIIVAFLIVAYFIWILYYNTFDFNDEVSAVMTQQQVDLIRLLVLVQMIYLALQLG